MPNTIESETSLLSKETLELIAEKYIIASVPTNFFQGLMAMQELASDTRELSAHEILIRLDSLTTSLDSFTKLIETYGLIVALSLKTDFSVSRALRRYSILKKDWISDIATLANAKIVPLDQYKTPIIRPAWEPLRPKLNSLSSTTEVQTSGLIAIQEEGYD